AIVVLESIFQKKEQGFKPTEAVLTGTKEVAGAVISSALTTIVVFIPIVLMDEEVGKMVIVLTVVVAVTLISYVIVAFMFISFFFVIFLLFCLLIIFCCYFKCNLICYCCLYAYPCIIGELLKSWTKEESTL